MSLRLILTLTVLTLISACSSTEVLKQPCSDPAFHFYVDDCGPLLPVNEAFEDVLVQP